MTEAKRNLTWKKSSLEQQEQDVLFYSANLSHRERLHLLVELQRRAFPEIFADQEGFYKKSLKLFKKRKIDW